MGDDAGDDADLEPPAGGQARPGRPQPEPFDEDGAGRLAAALLTAFGRLERRMLTIERFARGASAGARR